MTFLLLAALLPALFWDGGPETADVLRRAGIERVVLPRARHGGWPALPGLAVEFADPRTAVKLQRPGVNYRMNESGATSAPWVDTNGWQFIRQPRARFFYDVPGATAPLAAAEAFAFGGDAMVRTDSAGVAGVARMLAFLRKQTALGMPGLANIGVVDDGSPEVGELMKLLVRRNLLFRLTTGPDPTLDRTVRLGSPEYPRTEVANPSWLSQKIRGDLTDEKRLFRIYGSEVVVGRLEGDRSQVRLHLLNYAAASRPVQGLRIRVLGRYSRYKTVAFGQDSPTLQDYEVQSDATEFTLAELGVYSIIDLSP